MLVKDAVKKVRAIKLLHDNDNDIAVVASLMGENRDTIRRWKAEVGASVTELLEEVGWDEKKVDIKKIKQVHRIKSRKEVIETQAIETTIDELKIKVLVRLDEVVDKEKDLKALSGLFRILMNVEKEKSNVDDEDSYLRSIMQKYRIGNG